MRRVNCFRWKSRRTNFGTGWTRPSKPKTTKKKTKTTTKSDGREQVTSSAEQGASADNRDMQGRAAAGRARRVVLTGFMGSGKSTVGPLVAARLGWRFIDADDVIEAEAGATIAEIFRRDGEAAFRDRELATILRLLDEEKLVLALGGGAIEHAATREALAGTDGTLLVHLDVALDTTLAR